MELYYLIGISGQNAFALHNQLHPQGYRPSPAIMALATAPYREISSKFIGQRVDVNGTLLCPRFCCPQKNPPAMLLTNFRSHVQPPATF